LKQAHFLPTMRAVALLVLVAFACAGNASRVQKPSPEKVDAREVLTALLLAAKPAAGFAPSSFTGIRAHSRGRACPTMSVGELRIAGSGVTVTESMTDYAQKRISKSMDRYREMLTGPVDLQLKVDKRGKHDEEHRGFEKHIATITAYCGDGFVIRSSAESESMYASLDELSDKVARQMRKHKEKTVDVITAKKMEDREVEIQQDLDKDEKEMIVSVYQRVEYEEDDLSDEEFSKMEPDSMSEK